MSTSPRQVDPTIEGFHWAIESGTLEELAAALKNGADVNAPGRCGMTALMVAIDSRDLEKVKLLIRHGADPERTDDFNATTLRRAVHADFPDAVGYLLSLGVDRGYRPKYPLKQIVSAPALPHPDLPEQLKGVISEKEWESSMDDITQELREMDRNPTVEPMISEAGSVAVLKLFLQAGDDLALASAEVKRALLGLENGGSLRCTSNDYRAQKSPRYGTRNPEPMDLPFWREMIRTGVNAYTARQEFHDDDLIAKPEAVWCHERFGSSLTPLPDGRYVEIAGEHEDYYDPDFHIYNDVVIHDGQGDFQILGYPRDVFPPTDFHSATLCGDAVFVIGCLGYPEERREGFTPVYRLALDSWQMEVVETAGDMPGWIHSHRARYVPTQNVIRVAGGKIHARDARGELQLIPNELQFELDLACFQWRRIR